MQVFYQFYAIIEIIDRDNGKEKDLNDRCSSVG